MVGNVCRHLIENICIIQSEFYNTGTANSVGCLHSRQAFLNGRPARGSPEICHFIFLNNFHEYMFYSGNILRRKIFMNVSKNSDPDVGLRKLQYATRFH